jgi:hypothetical protein
VKIGEDDSYNVSITSDKADSSDGDVVVVVRSAADVIETKDSKSEPVAVKLSALATANSHKILDQLLDMTLEDDDDHSGGGGGFMTRSSSPMKESTLSSKTKQSKLLEDLLTIPVSAAVAVDCEVVETNTTYEAIYDAKEKYDEAEENDGDGDGDRYGGGLTINPSSTNRAIGDI